MLFGMELMGCQDLAVPTEVMHHVVRIESAFNPYAIGVVGGRLVRQPRNVSEAVATARDLEAKGYNFSVGLAQVNRHNLKKYGLASYEGAFQACPNLQAGARILAECHGRAGGDWGKSFSCYYSGNFVTGFRHGYVQKVMASMHGAQAGKVIEASAIAVAAVKKTDAGDVAFPRRLPLLQPQEGPAPLGRRVVPDSNDRPPVVLALAGDGVGGDPSDQHVGSSAPPTLAGASTQAPQDSAFVF